MDRLGKLFGRKTEDTGTDAVPEPPSGEAGIQPAHPADILHPADTEHPAGTPDQADAAPRETIRLAGGVSPAGDEAYGLKFVFDSGEARVFTKLPVAIGRSEENDLILNDETVSARHALVFFDERLKDVCILDLDSLNGVFIADQPTRKNVLSDGVRLALGNIHLVFRDTGYIHPA